LWINVIMDTFAAIALCSEPPRPGLMRQRPKRRDENILTPQMIRTIFITAGFFIVVMMILLLGLENGWWLRDPGGTPSKSFAELTYWQVAVFFTVYVMFQVWNQINCRSLSPEVSGFHRLFHNPVFLAIVGTIVVVQIVLVTFGGEVFEVAPLSPLTWLLIAVFTASVLGYAEIMRQIRLALARDAEFAGRGGWRPERRRYGGDVYEIEDEDLERGSTYVQAEEDYGRYRRRSRERED